MTPAEAAWVYDAVLPRRVLEDNPSLLICNCQYGRCGNCGADRHDRCWTHANGPMVGCETYVISRTGGALTEVWPAGKPCRWMCPCVCPTPTPVALEPEPDAPTQMSLFDLAGAP